MKIYTKSGDDGTTGLFYGGRAPKDDPRIHACGALDEAVATIGLARSFGPGAEGLPELLLRLQREMFVVGAQLATAPKNASKLEFGVSAVSAEMVAGLEQEIDLITAQMPLPDYFVVPGNTGVAAALDLARAVVRRAERWAVALEFRGLLAGERAAQYLNRLSDLLFVLARLEEDSSNNAAPPSRVTKGR